jgi:hypothetical protein
MIHAHDGAVVPSNIREANAAFSILRLSRYDQRQSLIATHPCERPHSWFRSPPILSIINIIILQQTTTSKLDDHNDHEHHDQEQTLSFLPALLWWGHGVGCEDTGGFGFTTSSRIGQKNELQLCAMLYSM